MVRATLTSPMEAAGPVDGRENPWTIPSSKTAAHRTLEIPAGFPHLPQGLQLDSHSECEKIRIGLGTLGAWL